LFDHVQPKKDGPKASTGSAQELVAKGLEAVLLAFFFLVYQLSAQALEDYS
jgi:hypothetical protein